MMSLLKFLSEFSFQQNERDLFLYIESFLMHEYAIKPLLAFSYQDDFCIIDFSRCRHVLGRGERVKQYKESTFKQLIKIVQEASHNQNRSTAMMKMDQYYYYYLNLGVKYNQYYFAIFAVNQIIPDEILNVISNFSISSLRVVEKFEELNRAHELIHIDDVTGLCNQRKLYKDLNNFYDYAVKTKEMFSILFIDIDHFKKVNDNYGHLVGTKLLEMVAHDIKNLLRDTDTSYRYGGDEFVVILAQANSETGKSVGERILNKIKSRQYEFDHKESKHTISLSVSIGVADFPGDANSAQEVLAIADKMMYEAKGGGRGMVFNTHDAFKTLINKKVSG